MAFVSLVPSARGFGTAMSSQITGQAATAGATAGKTAGGKFSGAFGGAVKGIGGTLLAGFAVSAVVGGIGSMTTAASDLNETISASRVIFGDNAKEIEAWASDSARNLGLPKQAALDTATNFGNMFQQIGFTDDAAASLSKSTVGLAADLGSFRNLPTADVADRISAAFRGEYDSLQLLIPNINAARVEQVALAATGKKTTKELTAQEKATAVLAIVNKDGAAALGNFAATSGEAANRSKIFQARIQDITTRIGQGLVPIFNTLLGVGLGVIDFFADHSAVLTSTAKVVGIVAGVITAVFLPALIRMGVTATIAGAKATAAWLSTQLGATKAALVQGFAVAKIVAGWALMGAKALLGAARVAAAWLIAMGPIGLVIAAVVGLVAVIVANFDKIKAWVAAAWDWVKTKTVEVWDAIVGFVAGIPARLLAAAANIWDWVWEKAATIQQNVVKAVSGFFAWIRALPGQLAAIAGDVFEWLVDQAADAGGRAWSAFKDSFDVGFNDLGDEMGQFLEQQQSGGRVGGGGTAPLGMGGSGSGARGMSAGAVAAARVAGASRSRSTARSSTDLGDLKTLLKEIRTGPTFTVGQIVHPYQQSTSEVLDDLSQRFAAAVT